MKIQQLLYKNGPTALLAIMLLGTLVFFSLLTSRNINFDDEGFYLLPFTTNQTFEVFPIQHYSFILKDILPTDWLNIFTFRWLRLTLTLLTSLVLAHGIYYRLNQIKHVKAIYFILPVLSLYSYVLGPFSLSYNSMNIIGIQLFLGSLLLIKSNRLHTNFKTLHLLLLGASIALCYYSKFTTGITLIILMFFFFLMDRSEIRQKIKNTLIFLSGLLLILLIFSIYYSPLQILYDGFALSSLSDHGYSLKDQLLLPYNLILEVYEFLIYGLLTFAVGSLLKNKTFRFILFTISVLFVYYFNWEYIKYTKGNPLLFFFIGFYFINGIKVIYRIVFRDKKALMIVMPFALILCGILGTNNPWVFAVSFYGILFITAFLLLERESLFSPKTLVLMITMAFNTFYFSYQPYRSPPPLQASINTDYERLRGIKISEEHLNVLNQFKLIIDEHHIDNNQYLGILWKYPMINFIFDTPSPAGVIWNEKQLNLIRHNYVHRDYKEFKVSWIVIGKNNPKDALKDVYTISEDKSFKIIQNYTFADQKWYLVSHE